jgi:hypothetical protein
METKLSKTEEGELLIHKEDGKGGFINILIDGKGNIEIIYIPSDKSKSWHKVDVSIEEAIEFWNKN